jgi:hypothetical protein
MEGNKHSYKTNSRGLYASIWYFTSVDWINLSHKPSCKQGRQGHHSTIFFLAWNEKFD